MQRSKQCWLLFVVISLVVCYCCLVWQLFSASSLRETGSAHWRQTKNQKTALKFETRISKQATNNYHRAIVLSFHNQWFGWKKKSDTNFVVWFGWLTQTEKANKKMSSLPTTEKEQQPRTTSNSNDSSTKELVIKVRLPNDVEYSDSLPRFPQKKVVMLFQPDWQTNVLRLVGRWNPTVLIQTLLEIDVLDVIDVWNSISNVTSVWKSSSTTTTNNNWKRKAKLTTIMITTNQTINYVLIHLDAKAFYASKIVRLFRNSSSNHFWRLLKFSIIICTFDLRINNNLSFKWPRFKFDQCRTMHRQSQTVSLSFCFWLEPFSN